MARLWAELASGTVEPAAYLGVRPHEKLKGLRFSEPEPVVTMRRDMICRRSGDRQVDLAELAPGMARDGPCLDVCTPGGNLFSHWLFDLWPKLHVARAQGAPMHRIIANDATSRYAWECLAVLGVDPAGIIVPGKVPVEITASEYWTVSAPRRGLHTPKWVAELVRDTFLPSGRTVGARRLYISRDRAKGRRVINEQDVTDFLAERGFQRVFMEDLTLRQAAELMCGAEIVVAPHGAGLANTVFCSRGCRVVEFFSWHLSPEYWRIGEVLDLNYICLEAVGPDGRRHYELTETERETRSVYHMADIRVDLADLARALSL